MKWLSSVLKFGLNNPLLVLVGFLMAALLVQRVQLAHAKAERNALAIGVQNERAKSADLEQLSKGAVAKLIVQQKVISAMAKEASASAAASVHAVVVVDSVKASGETVTTADSTSAAGSTRLIQFQFYKPPFHVEARVLSPPPPTRGSYLIHLMLDPMDLHAVVGCRDTGERARAALVAVRGPVWAHIRSVTAEADPMVCNAALIRPQRHGPSWWSVPVGAAAGALVGGVLERKWAEGAAVGGGVGLLFLIVF